MRESGPLGGVHRRCYRQLRPFTDPKREAKKTKADKAGAVVPEATVDRGQEEKGEDLRYEVKWQFKPIEANAGWKRYSDQDGLQEAGRARG